MNENLEESQSAFRIEASVNIPLDSKGIQYSFDEVSDFLLTIPYDKYWWPMIKQTIRQESGDDREVWLQDLFLVISDLQQEITVLESVSEGDVRYIKTRAEATTQSKLKLNYNATYKVENMGDNAKFTLIGELQIDPKLEKIAGFLQKGIEFTTRLALNWNLNRIFRNGTAKKVMTNSVEVGDF